MFRNPFYRQVFRLLVIIVGCMFGCKLTHGYFLIAVILAGLNFLGQRKGGALTVCYMLIPFFTVTNHEVVGLTGTSMLIGRLGVFALAVLSMVVGTGRGGEKEKIPLWGLYAYLVCAVVSSVDGWFPLISFLKILNFLLMLIGISFISKTMQFRDQDLMLVRAAMMAFAIIIIPGSVVTYFVPSIGYSMQVHKMEMWGMYLTGQEVASRGMSMFNGMTWHSQALAPLTGLFVSWVLCDLLLVEGPKSPLHWGIILISPVLLYMTRSRTGFVVFVAGLFLINFYCLPTASISNRFRTHVRSMFWGFLVLLLVVGLSMQLKNDAISRWLRKNDDVSADHRTLKEAMTNSRMGLVNVGLRDFCLNPLLGKGFQVMESHRAAYRAGAITLFSAPIEKGVLPIMVLGEGGLLGGFFFAIFLISFYAWGIKRRNVTCLTMFTLFLMSNMGEATFFSPAGAGGTIWMLSCVGGLCIDALAKRLAQRRRMDEAMLTMAGSDLMAQMMNEHVPRQDRLLQKFN